MAEAQQERVAELGDVGGPVGDVGVEVTGEDVIEREELAVGATPGLPGDEGDGAVVGYALELFYGRRLGPGLEGLDECGRRAGFVYVVVELVIIEFDTGGEDTEVDTVIRRQESLGRLRLFDAAAGYLAGGGQEDKEGERRGERDSGPESGERLQDAFPAAALSAASKAMSSDMDGAAAGSAWRRGWASGQGRAGLPRISRQRAPRWPASDRAA